MRLQNQGSYAFVSYLVKSIAAIQADLASIILNSSEERLARALVSIAPFRTKTRLRSPPRISQQTLADMIGTTRQHINLLMKRFRALGFIDYANGLKIHGSILNVSSRTHTVHTSQKKAELNLYSRNYGGSVHFVTAFFAVSGQIINASEEITAKPSFPLLKGSREGIGILSQRTWKGAIDFSSKCITGIPAKNLTRDRSCR